MFRIGQGYDVHRLCADRKLIIGGEEVPYTKGLLGHSDADVLLHAISDALLGASAIGDIGQLFPDSDSQFKDANSLDLLKMIVKKINMLNYRVINIDSTIIAQQPKFQPFIKKMRINIAEACGVEVDSISVKATTEEGLGFTGQGEGIAASAVCLIEKGRV
jgi:2-C-methyl-D-erythritol 2,4-cyclodiphosphate synthase